MVIISDHQESEPVIVPSGDSWPASLAWVCQNVPCRYHQVLQQNKIDSSVGLEDGC